MPAVSIVIVHLIIVHIFNGFLLDGLLGCSFQVKNIGEDLDKVDVSYVFDKIQKSFW